MNSSDYEALSEVVAFAPCEIQHCLNLTIKDDLTNEPEETLSLSLTKTTFITLRTGLGEVLIVDDDGKV